jgi:hypothetical protein
MYMNLQNPTPILLRLETRGSFIMRQQKVAGTSHFYQW